MNSKSNTTLFSYRTVAAIAILLLMLVALPATPAYALTCTATANGNWSTAGTWSGCSGGIPGVGDDVVINNNVTVTVTANASANSITFGNTSTNTATLTINNGVTLTVTNGITVPNSANADRNAALAGAGTINAASVTVGGTTTTLTGDGVTTLTSTISTLSLSGNLRVDAEHTSNNENDAIFDLESGGVSVGGTVALDSEDDGGNGSGDATLTLNGGGAESGTLTLSGTTPFTETGTGGTKTFDANGGSATVVYSGSGQSVRSTTYRTLTISNSGTKTLAGNVTINANLSVTGGTLDLSTFTANRSSSGGTFTLSNGATLLVGGASNFPGSYNTYTLGSSSTVNYYLAGTQTVSARTYGNLIFSGSGAKTMSSGTSTAGNLSIAPTGTATANINAGLNLSVNSLTLGGLGRVNGTWGSTSSTATHQDDTYFAATTGRLNVATDTRATPTINTLPTASGINYGQALSASNLTGGSASTTGSFDFTTPSTVPNAGTFSAPVTFTPTDLTSYTTVADNVDVAVAKVALSVTANNDSQVYNGVAYSGGNGVAYAGFVNGDDAADLGGTLAFSGTSQGAVNVGGYVITPGGLTSSNYNITFNNGTLTITAKPITVTADAGQTKVFGQANPVYTFDVSPALVDGDSFTGALSRDPGEDVGTYEILQGTLSAGSNYTITFVPDDFSITPKPILITPDDGQSKVFGSAEPPITFTSTPLESGDSFTGGLSRVPGTNVGTYAFTLGTLSAGSNYSLSLDPGHTFEITPKPITVTADSGQTKVFGDADPVFTYDVSPALIGGDSFSGALSRAAGENVGTYAITQDTLSAGSNYSITFVSANFSITAKPITVTADSGQTKVFGGADPVFTYVSSDLGASFTGALSRAAGENVGTYEILQGTLSAGSNYTITFVPDDFSITPKPILITPDDGQSKVYGATEPVLTYTFTPLESGDSFTGGLSRVANPNVGTYAFTLGTLSAGSNYTLSLDPGHTFEITPKPITVTADDKSKSAGDPDPAFTFSVSGFVGLDTLVTSPTCNVAGAHDTEGTYPIVCSGAVVGSNYTLNPYVNGTLTVGPMTTEADIDVRINGQLQASYVISKGQGTRQSYAAVNNGPVEVSNTGILPITAAERVIYKINNINTSFTEMMGLPDALLDNVYWLPWYNNVGLDTQLRFANVSSNPATVTVTIGGVAQTPINLAAGESTRISYPGIDAGPVKIESTQNIVAAERVIYKINNVNTSFSEMMALPESELDNVYWLPWYNNVGLDTQLRFANVSANPATVTVTIGGVAQTPINLAAGESTRVSYTGIDAGPVKIESTQNIVAAERVIYKINNINTSFSEMMALPDGQLDNVYWFPWYNNVNLDTQLRFANTTNSTATVHVYIGGVEMQGSPFTLLAGESTRQSFANIDSGPVQIVSNVAIVAAERVIYKINNINTSFSEMMGLPEGLLDTKYWFPWYNNVDLDTQLRFGVP